MWTVGIHTWRCAVSFCAMYVWAERATVGCGWMKKMCFGRPGMRIIHLPFAFRNTVHPSLALWLVVCESERIKERRVLLGMHPAEVDVILIVRSFIYSFIH